MPPYVNMVPKIIKYNINAKTTNIIRNFEQDKSYFYTPNNFTLKSVRIGPFTSEKKLKFILCDFTNKVVQLNQNNMYEKVEKLDDKTFYFVVVI
jgi:hypothetical protein